MRVNEFPKESIHKKIFLYSPDNPLVYFQKNQTVYYLLPKYTLDLSYCPALLILSSNSLLFQPHFSKSHPFFKVCFSVTSFMESSIISLNSSKPLDFPLLFLLLLLLHIACRDGYGISYAATQKKDPIQSVSL